MIHIKEFVISREEPADTTVGWLKPIEGGKYSIYFYGSKGWCSVVDETSGGGGSGSGIENIETEATSPLNLEATISGTLATITGSVDVATGYNYGTVKSSVWEFDTGWSPYSFSAQNFKDMWGQSAIDSGVRAHDSPQLFYKVYQPDPKSGIARDESLMVGIPYPAPENIVITDNINDVEYVLCITSEGYLRRVPVSLFTQE